MSILALLATFAAAAATCRIAMLIPILDRPDGNRKLQGSAVPRTGGIAVALVILAAYLLCFPELIVAVLSSTELTALIIYVAGAAVLGALDDMFTVPTKLKLIGLGILAIICVQPVDLDLPLWSYLIPAGTALWLLALTNGVNFMDGANGLAMGCVAIILCGYAIVFGISTDLTADLFQAASLLAAIALAGFLTVNIRGHIYAGDAGALGFGALIATLGLVLAQRHTIWLPATMALPMLVDVVLTVGWRSTRGHNLLTPHRHHAYQLFMRSGWRHSAVALTWWGLTAICVAFSIAATQSAWPHTPLAVFAVSASALAAAWLWQRKVYLPRAETAASSNAPD